MKSIKKKRTKGIRDTIQEELLEEDEYSGDSSKINSFYYSDDYSGVKSDIINQSEVEEEK